jgi:DNA-directed RNA polymerase specialized sigma24 family protein
MGSLPEKHNYGEHRLADIVRLLAVCQNETEKRLLQTALYHKVAGEFHDRCSKVVGKIFKGAPDIQARTEDLFQDSLIKIFEKINSFEINPHWGDQECEKVFLFWMSRFANNLLLNSWQKEQKEKKENDKYVKHITSDSSPGSIGKYNYKPTYDIEKFERLWSQMNLMSREIVLKCAEIGIFEEDGPRHLPGEFRNYLREKYKVADAAIRQAKGRAIEVLNSCKTE